MYSKSLFEKKFVADENTGCWVWVASIGQYGYGQLGWKEGESMKWGRAHRVAYELYVGPVPKGVHVLHRCDNRRCVNPDHLFLGNHAENMRDMAAKGRRKGIAFGARNGNAKLIDADVLEIRSSYHRGTLQRVIAQRFGVSRATVSRVIATWKFRHSP